MAMSQVRWKGHGKREKGQRCMESKRKSRFHSLSTKRFIPERNDVSRVTWRHTDSRVARRSGLPGNDVSRDTRRPANSFPKGALSLETSFPLGMNLWVESLWNLLFLLLSVHLWPFSFFLFCALSTSLATSPSRDD